MYVYFIVGLYNRILISKYLKVLDSFFQYCVFVDNGIMDFKSNRREMFYLLIRDKSKQVCKSRSISLYSHRNVEISKGEKRKEKKIRSKSREKR